eukprot:scaffold98384_cov42-Phaeocystis_antarctica.AAC.1
MPRAGQRPRLGPRPGLRCLLINPASSQRGLNPVTKHVEGRVTLGLGDFLRAVRGRGRGRGR